MVGGAGRKDDTLVINSTNVFAALGTLRKKKKPTDKDQGSSKRKGYAAPKKPEKEPEKQVYWAPAPLTVKSWADVEDEDDDDYYATTAPPASVWGTGAPSADDQKTKDTDAALETESEVEEEVDDEVEEEHENEPEAPVEKEPVVKPAEVSLPPKDTERQLSKKELKKKGLEELDAVLAELGYTKKETTGQDESSGAAKEKNGDNLNGEVEKKENTHGESKSSKKKKKKDKSSKDHKEGQSDHGSEVANQTDEATGTEKAEEAPAVDVKERLKKVASSKKKKSSKEMDAAARAAASEAAARAARLAAAKKKEKNHYNQQPVR